MFPICSLFVFLNWSSRPQLPLMSVTENFSLTKIREGCSAENGITQTKEERNNSFNRSNKQKYFYVFKANIMSTTIVVVSLELGVYRNIDFYKWKHLLRSSTSFPQNFV